MRLIDADQVIEDIKRNNNIEGNEPTWRSKDVITLLECAPTPPNAPLTLDELREMCGEPAWITDQNGNNGCYVIPERAEEDKLYIPYGYLRFCMYGKTWLAYRIKFKE